ncbi:DUF4296 domain-containing protein [Algoriphagus namhaensis]
MKKLLPIIFLLIVSFSCAEKEKPEFVISEDKLVSVLVDIHIAEGISSSLPIPYDSSMVMYSLLEKDLFEKHEVSDSVFTESLIYYLRFPEVMDEVYARVVDSLSKKQTLHQTQEAEQ